MTREDIFLISAILTIVYIVWSSWQFACIRDKLTELQMLLKELKTDKQ